MLVTAGRSCSIMHTFTSLRAACEKLLKIQVAGFLKIYYHQSLYCACFCILISISGQVLNFITIFF